MKTVDALREMEKVVDTLERAAELLTKKNESDAALHLSDRVLYSPLTTEVIAAHQAAMRVRDALLNEDID